MFQDPITNNFIIRNSTKHNLEIQCERNNKRKNSTKHCLLRIL